MAETSRERLSAIMRRAEEVRGLSPPAATAGPGAPAAADSLVPLLGQLVDDLEQSHRRLIEAEVQLVSLREVAGTLAGTRDAADATRLVTRYLRDVLGLDQVGLLLVDRERGVLTGTWAWTGGLEPVELSLVEGSGAAVDALWRDRTVGSGEPGTGPALRLDGAHPLAPVFAVHAGFLCVPLASASAPRTSPARMGCQPCAVGEPGAGEDAAPGGARLERRRACVACAGLPLLGVLAVARDPGSAEPEGERARIESVALTLAPMVENARLVHELTRSRRFLADVLDSMPSALLAVAPDGRALSLNRTAQELLALEEEGARGRPVRELLGESGDELLAGTLATGRPVSRQETVLRPPARAPLPVRLTTSQLRDGEGRAYGAIATFLDLTPLKAAEERARQLDQLAALGRFTSSVAHEIRNPLTGIGMGVRRLARSLADRPAEAEHVAFVLDEIRRLDRIVQELFDITHPRRLDLAARPLERTLELAELSLAAVFEERGVRVERQIEAGLPPVPHDADQLRQVFINLLKNAAEASPRGSAIRVRLSRQAEPAPAVVMTVADDGCGMDAETQATLFEPFFTTKPKGTGLGLYVTHDIVQRHGGTLRVTSAPGAGATFTVQLPLVPHGGPR
jgi:PAS domain S-box-containing protein